MIPRYLTKLLFSTSHYVLLGLLTWNLVQSFQFQEETVRFSAVLPVTISDLKFLSLFSHSCRNALTVEVVSDLHIVIPDKEFDTFSIAIANISMENWRLQKESKFVPEFTRLGLGSSGWQRQQEIKLAAYRHVKNSHFLTLDADVICTGIDIRNVVARSRTSQITHSCLEFVGGGSKFFGKKNIEPTLKSLQIDFHHDTYEYAMGWTPQIFNRELLSELDAIYNRRGTSLMEFLMLHGRNRDGCTACDFVWTEYFAYYYLAKQEKLWGKYHDDILAKGIEIGECFSYNKQPLPSRPGCLKLRVVCVEDAKRVLLNPNLIAVPFVVLNDHQMNETDFMAISQMVGEQD